MWEKEREGKKVVLFIYLKKLYYTWLLDWCVRQWERDPLKNNVREKKTIWNYQNKMFYFLF